MTCGRRRDNGKRRKYGRKKPHRKKRLKQHSAFKPTARQYSQKNGDDAGEYEAYDHRPFWAEPIRYPPAGQPRIGP
jgi:hypothetical protein